MVDDSTDISRLMDRIARQTASTVNMEDLLGVTLHFPELRLRAEQYYHYGAFCLFAKFHNRKVGCAQNKEKSKAKARAMQAPFSGCCRYGVWDSAFPVIWRGEVVAIFYLGHFLGDKPLASIAGKQYDGPPLERITAEKQEQLHLYGTMLRDFLLLALAEKDTDGALMRKRNPSREFFRKATEQYIATHYHKAVNLQTYAEQLQLHPNYLGQQVLLGCGARFTDILRDYRLDRACVLLRSSNQPITDIAFVCGFQDSNYFSTVFSRAMGKSPRAYRSELD
ncbi:helix-turn-helix transcriptional regulator [Cerasicoccus arenae]|uniref:HTH araC/xylS-type domain-containing protein n=1 Tax=Cerasicoccus arenae TaxID=424488 RepID=A0A8J3DEH1_9BACT|nr:AraC family transcriptional regulator [Cerasicoccus arenae]MBK1857902.1 helix-turn-helix domain-containing protein [Cerasicoccus arenae]GHC09550.1 hypothetical protein GCM10007047_28520 [Cerasicoccus arenae]